MTGMPSWRALSTRFPVILGLGKALDAVNAGKSPREVAIVRYGADEVTENWYSDGGLRANTRRRIAKARRLMEGGYRKLVARL